MTASPDKGSLIIIGASTRAAAESAIRAGLQPWCIDLFADRDLQAIATVHRCPSEQWPTGILSLLADAPDGPVLLTGAMENHLDVVRAIESPHSIFGMGAKSMFMVRQANILRQVADELRTNQFFRFDKRSPDEVINWPMVPDRSGRPPSDKGWLIKSDVRAGGGAVRHYRDGETLAQGDYFEQFISGVPMSGVFRVEANELVFAAFNEMIVGDVHFGANGFQYVGNIGPLDCPSSIEAMTLFARGLTAFNDGRSISGVFGVDAIRSATPKGGPQTFVLEVNPRFPASAEVWERSTGESVLNSRAIMTGPEPLGHLNGKAVVYAKQCCMAPDMYDWIDVQVIADVPAIGTAFTPGDPICTVFANGATRDECYAGLREQAERVYTRMRIQ